MEFEVTHTIFSSLHVLLASSMVSFGLKIVGHDPTCIWWWIFSLVWCIRNYFEKKEGTSTSVDEIASMEMKDKLPQLVHFVAIHLVNIPYVGTSIKRDKPQSITFLANPCIISQNSILHCWITSWTANLSKSTGQIRSDLSSRGGGGIQLLFVIISLLPKSTWKLFNDSLYCHVLIIS